MNIYLIGKNGQLGSDIFRVLSRTHQIEGGGRETFDIKHADEYASFFQHRYDVIINTSAYHNVPLCEKHAHRAYTINRDVPGKLAEFCFRHSIKLIHFSTDYVFDGKKHEPYTEEDVPNPLNVYGKSKYEGEQLVMKKNPNALIMRISGIYGKHISLAKGYNFPLRILEQAGEGKALRVTDKQTVSPTYTYNIAKQIDILLKEKIKGIVHCADKARITWYQFAEEILKQAGIEAQIECADVFDDAVKRPVYSVLGNKRLQDLNIDIMTTYQESIKAFLKEL